MIKTLNLNNRKKGRDFVIGDLHGQLYLLEYFLVHVKFDASVDRVISVGDLIDRGEDSQGCLQLLACKWFYCVKGNHEQMMEDYLTGGPSGSWWMHNGGNWYKGDFNGGTRESVVNSLKALPWLITVPMQDGRKFHVLHAEMPNLIVTDEILANKEEFEKLARYYEADGEACIWGRALWGSLYGQIIDDAMVLIVKAELEKVPHYFNDKLSHIYSGHTTMRQPTTIQGQTNLDTGAFRASKVGWAGLTATEPLTGKFWTTNNDGTREVKPLVI